MIPLERTQAEANRNYVNAYEENGLQVFLGSPNGVKSEITHDAWWRQKYITDYSIFHWLWTYDVPWRLWIIRENNVIVPASTSTKVVSINGTLHVYSGATIWNRTCIHSRRNPRYQPNRGHLYSSTEFLPTPTSGKRGYGIFTDDGNGAILNGVLFQLEGWILYWVIYNNGVQKNKVACDISLLKNFNIEKWNLYDIQFQWRGVWDYFFYVNQKLVLTIDNVGQLDYVSIENPWLPASYFSENTDGVNVLIKSWCVDISSEWGVKEGLTYTGISNSDDIPITSKAPPIGMLVCYNKSTFKGKLNFRDVRLLRLWISSDVLSRFALYTTEDITAFTWLSLVDRYNDSVISYQDAKITPFTFDTTKWDIVYRGTVASGIPFVIWNPSEEITYNINPWQYIVLVGEKKTSNALMTGILEFGEEI